MNPSESISVDDINLVRVYFTSDVDTSDTLSRSSCYCCISAMSSSVKSTIKNGDTSLAAFTKASLFQISDSVQSLFIIVFAKFGHCRHTCHRICSIFFYCCGYELPKASLCTHPFSLCGYMRLYEDNTHDSGIVVVLKCIPCVRRVFS